MLLKPVQPFPITVAPGFETFAEDMFNSLDSETVVWTAQGGEAVELRAIVRQAALNITTSFQTIVRPGKTIALVDASKVATILPGDAIRVRDVDMEISPGGVWPDGRAMVKLELREPIA